MCKAHKQNCISCHFIPGSPSQISKYADALLYLSLISGRNPELLIGSMCIGAVCKTKRIGNFVNGYMVVDGGAPTTFLTSAMPLLFLTIKMKLPCAQRWRRNAWNEINLYGFGSGLNEPSLKV
jgi:heptaprenylglyceryl phosphate synthase